MTALTILAGSSHARGRRGGGDSSVQNTRAPGKNDGSMEWNITRENLADITARAEAGNAYYQTILGEAYIRGEAGLRKNEPKGYSWLKKAAEKEHPIALYHMAILYKQQKKYKRSMDIQVDAEKYFKKFSFKELRRLANQGNPRAQLIYGWAVADRFLRYIPPDRAAMQVCERERRAWAKKAADTGYGYAQQYVAVFMRSEDISAAVTLYKKAASQGYADSMLELGLLYSGGYEHFGVKIEKDFEKAFFWYSKAAKAGNHLGYAKLAELYEGRNLVKRKWGMKVPRLKYQAYILSGKNPHLREKVYRPFYAYDLPLIKYKWRKRTDVMCTPALENFISRFIAGMQSGMEEMSKALFSKVLEKHAMELYLDGYWEKIVSAGGYKGVRESLAPMAGEIFRKVYDTEKNTPGFWIDYCCCALRAGRPELSLKGVTRMKEVLQEIKSDPLYKELCQISAIIKADSLLGMGRNKEAFTILFKNGSMDQKNKAIMFFLQRHGSRLMALKNKFSFATGITDEKILREPHEFWSKIPREKWYGKPEPIYDVASGKISMPDSGDTSQKSEIQKKPSAETSAKPKPVKPESEPKNEKPKTTVLE